MVFPVVMYGWESWTIKKAEHWRIDAFEFWCWRRLWKIPWTARRSNQSILGKISSEYSLEGLMLKLKLQYFGHIMRRTDSLQPHKSQHSRPPCPSPTCSNSCPSSQWCHPTISSSVIPFSSCLQSFPASDSFLMSQLFASGDQSTEASTLASVFLINIQEWFPWWLTVLISLQSNGL